ncbi:hypothetical protein RYX36_021820 [Vicia faba]
MSGVGDLLYDKDAVYININDHFVQFSKADDENTTSTSKGNERDVGEVLVKSLQNTKYSINEKLESSSINLFRQNSIDHAVEEDGELETLDSGEDNNGVDSDGSESSDQDETDRETGQSKQISTVPIQLSICSPNVVNLTLIDLPGLTKVAVEGQPDSIVHDIENMVRSYIEKLNCIILAISPANQDIATSDAIKISREVDPTGERTIGVLTKIDPMDKGTDVVDMLEGRAYRLKFPWIGVVNRSQADINKNDCDHAMALLDKYIDRRYLEKEREILCFPIELPYVSVKIENNENDSFQNSRTNLSDLILLLQSQFSMESTELPPLCHDQPSFSDNSNTSGRNVFSLLAQREISPRTKHVRKWHWGESSKSKSSCSNSKRMIDAKCGLLSWVEAESLRHLSAKYCPLLPPPRSTIAATFSQDGKVLASIHGDHTVNIIDCETGNCLKVLVGHRRTPWVVRFHPLQRQILASGSLDQEVRLWDASTSEWILYHYFNRPIASLAFHASGEIIAVASGHKLYMWPYKNGGESTSPVFMLKTRRSLRAVHFHPHGAPYLLTAQVNDLDSSDSSMTEATYHGYLQYPPPAIFVTNVNSRRHINMSSEPPNVSLPLFSRPSYTVNESRVELQHASNDVGSSSMQVQSSSVVQLITNTISTNLSNSHIPNRFLTNFQSRISKQQISSFLTTYSPTKFPNRIF